MSSFVISNLFKTTNKGLPNTAQLPSDTEMTTKFYALSMVLQILMVIIFAFAFALAIYRRYKSVINKRFDQKYQNKSQEEQSNHHVENQKDNQQNNGQNSNAFLYKFDEEDHQKEKVQEITTKRGKLTEQQLDDQEQQHQEINQKVKKYLAFDHQFLTFQPILIGCVICNCMFATDEIGIIALVITLLSFFLFTIKQLCQSMKLLSSIYIFCGLLLFIPFYLKDHDITT